MKRLFILLAAVVMTASAMAKEEVKWLPADEEIINELKH